LIQAVKRNRDRFPADFMFQLTKDEWEILRLQIETSNNISATKQDLRLQNATSNKRGGRRYLPYAFTEEGVAMLSSVLNSERAIIVNIHIMRAFVNLRRAGLTYLWLKRKIEEMERKYDKQFKFVFDSLKKILEPPVKEKKIIGFQAYEHS